jgi:RsiW-degrading membrane proteinase PrsW (M82 family)
MSNGSGKWYGPIAHFFGHTVVGTLIFFVIALPAVGLSFFVKWLEHLGIQGLPIQVLTFLEGAILILDALSFLAYLCVTTVKFVRELVK